MADFNEFKMDLRIERVTPSDEGEYICLYRDGKLVHEKHVYLKVLSKSFHPKKSQNFGNNLTNFTPKKTMHTT